MGIEWFRAGTGKLRGTRKGLVTRRCPLCNGKKDAIHVLYPETKRLREHLMSRKWQIINEELAYKKIINCIHAIEIRNLGRYLYKLNANRKVELRNYS
jgi:hypothetical protein